MADTIGRATNGRTNRWGTRGGHLLLLVPLLVALVFMVRYATATPLTDEWVYTKLVASLRGEDLTSPETWTRILRACHFKQHWVVVPFLFYWPVIEWADFDSRWIMALTIGVFGVEMLLYRRYLVPSLVGMVPLALVLFCPSHYMEFLWGWQLTLALSIAFTMAGLIVIDRISDEDSTAGTIGKLGAGLVLSLLATFSSACGFFALPSVALLVLLKRPRGRRGIVVLGAIVLATIVVSSVLFHSRGLEVTSTRRDVLELLTMLGGTVAGVPLVIPTVHASATSVIGGLFLVSFAAIAVCGARMHALRSAALPLSLAVFGLLCVTSAAVSRELGSWHVQLALPAVCGIYATGFVLWKEERSLRTAVPFLATALLLCASVFGYVRGFRAYGPQFRRFAASVEDRALRYLEDPDAVPGDLLLRPVALDADLLLFLSAHDLPLFARSSSTPVMPTPLTTTARVFVDGREIERPFALLGGVPRAIRITAAVPDDGRTSALIADVGERALWLRRVHRSHTRIGGRAPADAACYSGVVLPERMPRGLAPVELWRVGPDIHPDVAHLVQSVCAEPANEALARSLYARGYAAVDAILEALADSRCGDRNQLAHVLGRIGGPALPKLDTFLDGDDPEATRLALVALEAAGVDARGRLARIVRLAESSDPAVREAALSAVLGISAELEREVAAAPTDAVAPRDAAGRACRGLSAFLSARPEDEVAARELALITEGDASRVIEAGFDREDEQR